MKKIDAKKSQRFPLPNCCDLLSLSYVSDKTYKLVFFLIITLLITMPSVIGSSYSGDPLVLVVHGIGGGNRPDGWSDNIVAIWGLEDAKEITYRYEGRIGAISLADFARTSGDWAIEVQRQIQQVVESNPNRPIVIVSHSWGTVATSMALAGGVGGGTKPELIATDYQIDPIDLGGRRVSYWVTLGSPLGRAYADVAVNLRQLNVAVNVGRPDIVDNWINIFDEDDPVSMQSHNLEGATNIGVSGSGSGWDPNPLKAHTGIWTNPTVINNIRDIYQELRGELSGDGANICSWAGTWKTNWGKMTLTQSGNSVTGNYVWDDGRIQGTVTGDILIGKWSEKASTNSYCPPDNAGDLIFFLSGDCDSFTGYWRYGHDSLNGWSGGWKGDKME